MKKLIRKWLGIEADLDKTEKVLERGLNQVLSEVADDMEALEEKLKGEFNGQLQRLGNQEKQERISRKQEKAVIQEKRS